MVVKKRLVCKATGNKEGCKRDAEDLLIGQKEKQEGTHEE